MADTRFTCITCITCGLAPAFHGFDDCLECGAAYLIVDSDQLSAVRRLYAGTAWLVTLNAEIERQLLAVIACGRAAA
jgi:hypothetical protein